MKVMFGDPGIPHYCEGAHFVQLYGDNIAPLASNVGYYLAEGRSVGEPALVIAAPEHAKAFVRELENNGYDVPEAIRTGWLVLLDSGETLAQLMPNTKPDWKRFEKAIRARIQSMRSQTGAGGVRVYGEMVGLLWNDGRTAEARRLEEMWNRHQAQGGLTLFCAYQIDVFGREFQDALAGPILAAHSAMISGLDDEFEGAIDGAALEVMGMRPGRLEAATGIPGAEGAILSLRSQHPECADEVLARARAAMEARAATSKRAPSHATTRCLPD